MNENGESFRLGFKIFMMLIVFDVNFGGFVNEK